MSRETVQLVNKDNLRIARENVGYTTREATDKVCGKNTKADRVKEWEDTESNPTWKQLDKMANMYDINLFLLAGNKKLTPHREIRDFRKSDGAVDKGNVKKFLHFLLRRQKFMEYMMKGYNARRNQMVGIGSKYRNSPERLAEFISEKIGYRAEDVISQREPVKYFINLIEERDIFVMKTLSSIVIDVEDMRGVYVANAYAPIIAINRRDSKTAQMFTLAHELAHLFMDSEGVTAVDFRDVSRGDPIERFCNAVASNLLIPERVLEDKKYSLQDVIALAGRYKVSELFTLYRLKSAGRVRKSDAVGFEKEILKRMKEHLREKQMDKDKGVAGGNYINSMKDTNGKLFNTFISSLYFEGRLNAAEAGNVLRICVTDAV